MIVVVYTVAEDSYVTEPEEAEDSEVTELEEAEEIDVSELEEMDELVAVEEPMLDPVGMEVELADAEVELELILDVIADP